VKTMKQTNNKVTHERLLSLVTYDPNTGVFMWNKTQGCAGSIDNNGYCRISIDRVRYKAHRLAWFYVTKVWPNGQIDHIDGDKLNNKFSNIRDVTPTINMYNKKKAHKNNTCGFLGVSVSGSKYVARLKVQDKLMHLGTFDTPSEAHATYMKAKREHLETQMD